MVSSILAQAILNQKTPDIVGSFKAGLEESEGREKKRLAGLALQQGGGFALDELSGMDPEYALNLGEAISARSAQDINNFIRDSKYVLAKINAGDNSGALTFAKNRRDALRLQNRDTTQTDELVSNLEQGNIDVVRQTLMSLNGINEQAKGVVVDGRIVNPVSGEVIYEGEAEPIKKSEVQSSEILPSGATVQVMKDGTTRVTSPEGDELKGQGRAEAVREAREYGIKITGERAGARSGKATLSKERAKVISGLRKFKAKFDNIENKSRRVIRQARSAIKSTSGWTGGPGSLLRVLPGTPQANLSQLIKTIEANIGFDTLQEMRDSSPTGGALGQVAVEELKQLQRNVASLDLSQSPDVIKKNLEEVITQYERYINSTKKAYLEDARVAKEGFVEEMGATDSEDVEQDVEDASAQPTPIIRAIRIRSK